MKSTKADTLIKTAIDLTRKRESFEIGIYPGTYSRTAMTRIVILRRERSLGYVDRSWKNVAPFIKRLLFEIKREQQTTNNLSVDSA